MITPHLTETELQLYEAEPETISNELKAHVQDCAQCQVQAANYALLFKSIYEISKPAFDFDLSALVIAQLPQSKPTIASEKWINYTVLSTVGFVSLILLYLVTPYLSAVFSIVSPLFTCLIIICTVGISVFLFRDMYRSYQQKFKQLNLTSNLQQ